MADRDRNTDRSKSYCIVEVLHDAITANEITKDKYQSVANILYMHSDRDKCIVKLNELLDGYPKEKFTLLYQSPVQIQIIDSEKKSSMLKYYRDNKLIKTLCLLEHTH
jgi:hypothetical protein